MTSILISRFKQKIASFELIPAGGGCFEVSLDGETIYSKLATGVFPNELDLATLVAERLAASSGIRLKV